MFSLALVQMHVEHGKKLRNLDHACEMISEAAKAGAQVILLPETMPSGWTHSDTARLADRIPGGKTCRVLRKVARWHKVYICCGLAEKDGGQVYNSAVLVDPKGNLLLRYRKLNEMDIGHGYYAQGDRLSVAHTPLGTFGVHICADAGAKDWALSRALGYMGADIILSPSCWAVPADHDNEKEPYGATWRNNYIPVAREFKIWIAGASNVGWLTSGPWNGYKCIGCSLVIDPDGKEIIQGPYGPEAETILYMEVAPRPRPTRGNAWYTYWDSQQASGQQAKVVRP
ncbi:MAG TPA: carbon-nitrogen hydrolase family protein [bacterium]|nr:carbon-nitrogen hydrolase family protein [bacterium]